MKWFNRQPQQINSWKFTAALVEDDTGTTQPVVEIELTDTAGTTTRLVSHAGDTTRMQADLATAAATAINGHQQAQAVGE